MAESKPLVSVVVPLFNAEKFIAEALQSLIVQSYTNLQIIVVNDGSTDASEKVARSFKDPRIEVINQQNQGPSQCLNRGIAAAKGDYIAILSGDDVAYPDRIQHSLNASVEHKMPIVFGAVELVNEEGLPLTESSWASGLFPVLQLDQPRILERFFCQGNFLNANTFFCESRVLPKNPFSPGLLQLQDFDLWIRLAKKHLFFISPNVLAKYRIKKDDQNLSSPSPTHHRRADVELFLILNRFFDEMDDSLFLEIFKKQLMYPIGSQKFVRLAEEILLLNGLESTIGRLAVVKKAEHLLKNVSEDLSLSLDRDYALNSKFIFNNSGIEQIISQEKMVPTRFISSLFYSRGAKSFFEERSIKQTIILDESGNFLTTFDLKNIPSWVTYLRFDPLEGEPKKARLTDIFFTLTNQKTEKVKLKSVINNGVPLGEFSSFLNGDPQFLIKNTKAAVVSITFSGEIRGLAFRETINSLDKGYKRKKGTP